MLLDTSGLLVFFDANLRQHADAVRLMRTARRRLVHSYVLAEFVALAKRYRHPADRILTFLARLQRNPLVQVVYVDEPLHLLACDLLGRRLDKDWSLADAVSFVLMEQQGITDALSTDHHFEQAGFVRLLSDPS